MKINPINCAYNKSYYAHKINSQSYNTTSEAKSITQPISDSYGRAMVFKSNSVKNIISNASFDDKLAVGIKKLLIDDEATAMLVANNMKEISKMMDYLMVPSPIKKLLVLTDSRIKDNMFFARSEDGIAMVNASHVAFVSPMMEYIAPGELTQIGFGERYHTSQGWFEIKEVADNSPLEEHSSEIIKEFDYTEKVEQLALKHNKEIKTQLQEISNPRQKSNELSFDSIGGQDEVIDTLRKNILFPIRYPEVFEGFMLNRGTILYGPPGTGKTLLAKALAVESGASVFELCGTELANKYVGQSEENCRELFQKAVDAQPSIIYFDEIEALGKKRGDDKYCDKLLTQFLSCMSELEKNGDQVFIIGSTNRKEDLDPAFIRSGRFSILLEVKAPDLEGTKQILDIHTNNKPMDKDFDRDMIAEKMYARKMTGADIAATIKDAFSIALERSGIYKSMQENRFSPAMKDYLTITNADIIKAIDEFKNGTSERNPVGFKK